LVYDLAVVGGGPAGLTAARVAAEQGLRVVLVERKREITDTSRTDVSIFYWKFLLPDSYIEPIALEIATGKSLMEVGRQQPRARFRYQELAFTFDYDGPLLPYHHFISFSPGGRRVYSLKDELWGMYYSRECVLRSLLEALGKTPAEVRTETFALGVENKPEGVALRVRAKGGEEVIRARKLIAADGVDSTIVESLGLNRDRRTVRAPGAVGYILEGVEPDADIPAQDAWMTFLIPSLGRGGIMLALHSENGSTRTRHLVGEASSLDFFMKESRYAGWFRHARLLRKTAVAMVQRTPTLRDEVADGNVLIISDAISNESWIQGAIACGCQGARAVVKELGGRPGYNEYISWLKGAFAFWAYPDHFRLKAMHHILKMSCNDDEIDYIFGLLQDRVGHPAFIIADNPEIVRQERPELYQKLKKAIHGVNVMAAAGWSGRAESKLEDLEAK
jgi:flavin-dependent dehydrogenase